jgi:hypothetical protein
MQSVLPKNVHVYGPMTCDTILYSSGSLKKASEKYSRKLYAKVQ